MNYYPRLNINLNSLADIICLINKSKQISLKYDNIDYGSDFIVYELVISNLGNCYIKCWFNEKVIIQFEVYRHLIFIEEDVDLRDISFFCEASFIINSPESGKIINYLKILTI